jgi:hypothetical protein
MRRHASPPPKRHLAAAALLAPPLAEVGHALAYLMRYGPIGLRLETEGVHAYLPAVLRSSALLIGMSVLLLLVIAAGGRILIGRGFGLRRRYHRWIDLALVFGCIQIATYIAQESLEALAGHQPYTFGLLAIIVGWGLVGQLPVATLATVTAVLGAAALEVSLEGFRSALEPAQRYPSPIPPVSSANSLTPAPVPPLPLLGMRRCAATRRGPPLLLGV